MGVFREVCAAVAEEAMVTLHWWGRAMLFVWRHFLRWYLLAVGLLLIGHLVWLVTQ